MRRRRVVWWSVVAVTLGVLGVFAAMGGWIPGPKPSFPEGSGVRTYVNDNSLPPGGESGFEVRASSITRDSAHFHVYVREGDDGRGTLRVGETATLAGVTIALCDTWVNKWAYVNLSGRIGGQRANASRVYYVQSTDGSTPRCP